MAFLNGLYICMFMALVIFLTGSFAYAWCATNMKKTKAGELFVRVGPLDIYWTTIRLHQRKALLVYRERRNGEVARYVLFTRKIKENQP